MTNPSPGSILWHDLTVPNAEKIRAFYCDVVGWKSEPVDMGGYSDFNMLPPGSKEPSAGICHARGVNAKIPPKWLIYISVNNIDRAIERCKALGGRVIDGPRPMSGQRFCVIEDPAGAVAGLIGT